MAFIEIDPKKTKLSPVSSPDKFIEISPDTKLDEVIGDGVFRQEVPVPQPASIEQPPLELGEVAVQAFQNIPASAGQFAKNLITPFIEPVETAKSLGTLAAGLFQKAIPGRQPSEDAVDAVADFLKERYGGIENVKRTIATDPVGFASDLSILATGGGAAAGRLIQLTGKTGTVATKALKAAELVGKAGRTAEPLNLATAPIKAIARLTPASFTEKLVESGIKFSAKIKPAQRSKIIQAVLDEKITPTKAGLKKTGKLIERYSNQVDDVIDRGIRAGKGGKVTIKTDDVLARLDDVRDTFEASAFGLDFADDITATASKFKEKFGDTITASQAQEIKRNTQQILRKSFGQLSNVKSEAGKAIARGLREELEVAFPEVATLNQKNSALIGLNKELERAVARISNKDIIGLGTKVLATGGTAGNILGAVLEQIIGQAKFKSKLAFAINSARKKPISGKELPTILRQLSAQAGRVRNGDREGSVLESLPSITATAEAAEPPKPTFQPRLSQGLRKINGSKF